MANANTEHKRHVCIMIFKWYYIIDPNVILLHCIIIPCWGTKPTWHNNHNNMWLLLASDPNIATMYTHNRVPAELIANGNRNVAHVPVPICSAIILLLIIRPFIWASKAIKTSFLLWIEGYMCWISWSIGPHISHNALLWRQNTRTYPLDIEKDGRWLN